MPWWEWTHSTNENKTYTKRIITLDLFIPASFESSSSSVFYNRYWTGTTYISLPLTTSLRCANLDSCPWDPSLFLLGVGLLFGNMLLSSSEGTDKLECFATVEKPRNWKCYKHDERRFQWGYNVKFGVCFYELKSTPPAYCC